MSQQDKCIIQKKRTKFQRWNRRTLEFYCLSYLLLRHSSLKKAPSNFCVSSSVKKLNMSLSVGSIYISWTYIVSNNIWLVCWYSVINLTMEILVLAWDRHKTVVMLNWIPIPPLLDVLFADKSMLANTIILNVSKCLLYRWRGVF